MPQSTIHVTDVFLSQCKIHMAKNICPCCLVIETNLWFVWKYHVVDTVKDKTKQIVERIKIE